jgi:pyridoxal biosynthesis lyase PdxS
MKDGHDVTTVHFVPGASNLGDALRPAQDGSHGVPAREVKHRTHTRSAVHMRQTQSRVSYPLVHESSSAIHEGASGRTLGRILGRVLGRILGGRREDALRENGEVC